MNFRMCLVYIQLINKIIFVIKFQDRYVNPKGE